jgi:type IX secretion system PorP/SprF family membrane protein
MFFTSESFSQAFPFPGSGQSLVYLNPSFAGSNGLFRNQLTYSAYQLAFSGNEQLFTNSADVFISAWRSGIAVSTLYHHMGPFTQSECSFSYARYFSFLENKLKLIPSLQLEYGLKKIDSDWIVQIPGSASNQNLLKEYFTLGSGLLVNYNNFYFGVSASHLRLPQTGDRYSNNSFPTFHYHASYNLHLGKSSILNFSTRFSDQVAVSSLVFGINALLMNHLVIGSSYVLNDAVYFTTGYKADLFNIQLGYSSNDALSYYHCSGYHVLAAFNLRTKAKRNELTNFEEW